MHRPSGRLVAWSLGYALALVLVMLVGGDTEPASWCLPTAIGVGMLARTGYRKAWILLVLEVAAELAAGQGTAAALLLGGATTGEVVFGAWLVRRLHLRIAIPADTITLGLVSVLTATLGATLAITAQAIADPVGLDAGWWFDWAIGDVTAMMTVLPLVIVSVDGTGFRDRLDALRGRWPEASVVLAAAVVSILLSTVISILAPQHAGAFRFLWALPVIWAAVRFDRFATSVTVVVTSLTAFAMFGRLVLPTDALDRTSAQGTLVVVGLLGIAVAVTLADWRRALGDVKSTVDALEASEHRYATLFAASPAIQLLVDPETMTIVDANAAAAAFYGYTIEDLRAKRVTDLSLADPGVVQSTIRGAPGGSLHLVAPHRHWSGEPRMVEIQTGPIELDGRRLLHSVTRDVTAEYEARLQVTRLAAAVESTAEAIITTDLEGRVTGWNAAAEFLYGFAFSVAMGRQVADLLGPLTIPHDELAAKIRQGRSERFTQVIRSSASGERIPVDLTVSPIRGQDGVVGMSRISHDLRTILAEEERLRRSEALLADAAEIGGMGSWEFDRASGEAIWSDELYRIAGTQPGTPVRTSTLAELAHPDDRSAVEAAFAPGSTAVPPIAFRIRDRAGAERSVVATWRFVRAGEDAGGREVGVVRDVTEERALEEQLRQAQRVESIGLLAGGVAHDFNNLLTAIAGFTELARMSVAEGDSPEADLLEVQSAVDRARALTSQLLAFGRRAIVQPRPVELGGAVEHLVPMLRRLLGEDITILTELDEAVAVIDPGQLDQVVVNLAVNARDAMAHGGILRIATGRTPATGQDGAEPSAWIEVEDDGAGIPPEHLDRIFLPFFTTKERGKGTGLGLSTVQGIVGQAGGRIEVSSNQGTGTVFRIELPLTEGAVPEAGQAPATTQPSAVRGLVLLVEDEDLVRRVGERVLTRAGFRVAAAANLPDAMTLADRERPDILVTDVVLPGIGDGVALAETLRARWPTLPVLIMTGYMERNPPDWATLITKPYDVDQLVGAVRRLVDGAGALVSVMATPAEIDALPASPAGAPVTG